MLREGWNFKNDIAVGLEHRVCNLYGYSDRPYGTIFDSDLIEMKTFAECMILAIRKMSDYTSDNEEVNTFVEKCYPYLGVSGNKILPENAQILYDEFKKIQDSLKRT